MSYLKALFFSILMIIAALIISSCASKFKQSGIVFSDQNVTIPKALIKIIESKSGKEHSTYTDDGGVFTMEDIEEDTVHLYITAEYFDFFDKELILKKNLPQYPPQFQLEPARTKIFGFVRDKETGEPIIKARIVNDLTGSGYSEITDEDGRYEMRLEDILEGINVNVSSSKVGYSSSEVSVEPALNIISQCPDILMPRRISSDDKIDSHIGDAQVERTPGGSTSLTDNNQTDPIVDLFLSSHQKRGFTKSDFISHLKSKGHQKQAAEEEFRALINNRKIQKENSGKYRVLRID